MNKETIKEILYILIAIILGIVAVKFVIWLLPMILIAICSYYIYKSIKKNKNNSNKRKKIFMGDTGSLTIGILLSFFSIELSSYCSISEIPDINFFIVAFSPLVVPCFDVVRVFILRVRNGKHPFKPDRSHIHHKLLNLGISQRWVMVLIIALSLFYVLLNMLLSQYYNSVLVLLVDVIIWILFNYFLFCLI